MTTTDVFQGMDEGSKPSSRVLRPPGGGSNITFGGGDEPSQSSPRSQVAGGQTPPVCVAAGAPTPNKPGTSDVEAYRDRLYGGGQTTEVKTKSGGNPKNMGTYNPITGKELVEPKEQVCVLPPREMKPVHTSTRVRQPPGGASSGIW